MALPKINKKIVAISLAVILAVILLYIFVGSRTVITTPECGDNVCSVAENSINCPSDCSMDNLPCAKEREFVNPMPGYSNDFPDECCDGLKPMAAFDLVNGTCESIIGTPFLTCMPCGDGTCLSERLENSCNCLEDCGAVLSVSEYNSEARDPEQTYRIRGFVAYKYDQCAPCPPGAVCMPCIFPHLILSTDKVEKVRYHLGDNLSESELLLEPGNTDIMDDLRLLGEYVMSIRGDMIVFYGTAGQAGDAGINGDILECGSFSCIRDNSGSLMKLAGTYESSDAGKTWVTVLSIGDGTSVLLAYTNGSAEYEGRQVEVIANVYEYLPEYYDKSLQYLLLPHADKIGSIRVLDEADVLLHSCAKEREFVNPVPGYTTIYHDECCEGLKPTTLFDFVNGTCEPLMGTPFLTCMPCGDGTCLNERLESWCNCPEDCGPIGECTFPTCNTKGACTSNDDCAYFGYAGGCFNKENLPKCMEEMTDCGLYPGEAPMRENVTCSCQDGACVEV